MKKRPGMAHLKKSCTAKAQGLDLPKLMELLR